MDFVVRRGGRDDVDRLEPLWRALRATITLRCERCSRPVRLPSRGRTGAPSTSTGSRRTSSTLLLAERDGEPIGYVVVSLGEGAATWDIGSRTAEIT